MNRCVDCGKIISKKAVVCRMCHGKRLWRTNEVWIGFE